MANKIWKEVFLIMCSSSRKNARNTERFSLSLRITDDYALQTLCGEQHNVANEEGKLEGLPLNRALRDDDGEVYDVVAGPFLLVGLTEDDFGSLSSEQIQKFEGMFHQPEAFIKTGRSVIAVPIPDEVLGDKNAPAAGKTKSEPAL